MRNSFGQFDEEAFVLFNELATDKYDFMTCQRGDGSYYGTGGTCRKGVEATKPEKAKEKSDAGPAQNAVSAQDAKDMKTVASLEKTLVRANQTIMEREYGDFGSPKYLTDRQEDALDNLGLDKYEAGYPSNKLVKLNEAAVAAAARNYSGGTEKFKTDFSKAAGWDSKKKETIEPEDAVKERARVEKATRTEFQKMVKEQYGITLPKNVRSPFDFVANGYNNEAGYNDRSGPDDILEMILDS